MAIASATPKITKCPPGAATGARFDEYVQQRIALPVSARFVAGGEVESTGLDFGDWARMGRTARKLSAYRDENPTWPMDDNKLRAVLVRYLERRAQLRRQQKGSEPERLQRALEILQASIPLKDECLTRLAQKYVAMKKRTDADSACIRKLAEEIEGLDTVLVMEQNIATKVLMIAYLYYRLGLDSVEVAAECGIKPPHVRMLLLRLRTTAAELGFQKPPSRCARKRKSPALNPPVKHRVRYEDLIKSEAFNKALEKSIAARPDIVVCKAGHDLVHPEAGHILVGDLLRLGRRICRSCWKLYQAAYKKRRCNSDLCK